jgi:hypothetical protein
VNLTKSKCIGIKSLITNWTKKNPPIIKWVGF